MKVLLWGGKSKALIAAEMLRGSGIEPALVFDYTLTTPYFHCSGRFINRADQFASEARTCSHFVVCIGGERGFARVRISEFLSDKSGLIPLWLRHRTSFAEDSARLGKGVQLMAGSIVGHQASVGDYSIINTNAHVDHECVLGRGVHIMGGGALAGKVTVGDFANVGTNATILPDLVIGEGAFVGAGSVVTRDVPAFTVVAGSPARILRQRTLLFDTAILEQILRSGL